MRHFPVEVAPVSHVPHAASGLVNVRCRVMQTVLCKSRLGALILSSVGSDRILSRVECDGGRPWTCSFWLAPPLTN
jgi:hypothetical protein